MHQLLFIFDRVPVGREWADCVVCVKDPHCAGKDGNKHMGLDIRRIQYWLSVGAQPTKTVARLLGQAAVIPKPPPPQSEQRGSKKDMKVK